MEKSEHSGHMRPSQAPTPLSDLQREPRRPPHTQGPPSPGAKGSLASSQKPSQGRWLQACTGGSLRSQWRLGGPAGQQDQDRDGETEAQRTRHVQRPTLGW